MLTLCIYVVGIYCGLRLLIVVLNILANIF